MRLLLLHLRRQLHEALQRGEVLAQVEVAAEPADQLVEQRSFFPAFRAWMRSSIVPAVTMR
jgi:hypothetical protein